MNPEKIAFLLDSTADMTPEVRKGKPFYVAPLRIACADGDYNDGENITNMDVYEKQEAGDLPKTSLPELTRVEEELDRIKADGYEKVIVLPLSSGLSGTHNMMTVMCEERDDLETAVFETYSAAIGISMVALELWKEIEAGMTWEELVNGRVRFLIDNTFVYFSVDTLEYLQKGGRIGKITAMAGTLLSIKPLLGFTEDGQLVNKAKARGSRQVPEKLVELIQGHVDDPSRPYNLAVEHGGNPEGMAEVAELMRKTFPKSKDFYATEMDATLATYVGRGMLGAGIQFLK